MYTELNTINDKKIQITVSTDSITETQDINFTCRQSTILYIERLQTNLQGTQQKICINDTLRGITFKHNLTQSTKESQSKQKRLKTDNVKYRPNELVVCEKSNAEINRERIEQIMLILELNKIQEVENLVKQYFSPKTYG